MGAQWIQSEGLHTDDQWFKSAVILTCVFTFLYSWLPFALIILGGIICCAFCCCFLKNCDDAETQVENTVQQQEKIEKQQKTTEKMNSVIDTVLGKVLPKIVANSAGGLLKKGTNKGAAVKKPERPVVKDEPKADDEENLLGNTNDDKPKDTVEKDPKKGSK